MQSEKGKMRGLTGLFLASGVVCLLCMGCGRDSDVGRALERGKTAVGEALTPEAEDTEAHLVVRQAKLEQRRREDSQWTDRNIAKHPELYLEHSLVRLGEILEDYDVALFSARKEKAYCEGEAERARELEARAQAFLDEARPYFTDPDGMEWPAKVNGQAWSREGLSDMAGKMIEHRNKERNRAEAFLQKADRAAKTIDQGMEARQRVEELMESIRLKQIELRAGRNSAGIRQIAESVRQISATAEAIQPEGMSVEEASQPSPVKVREDLIRKEFGL